MELTQLEKRFEKCALIRGGVFLLSPVDAIQFVNACKEQGIAVLGIEGFKVLREKIQPFQEHSLDFEDVTDHSQEATLAFLEDRKDSELWFEIIIEDR